MEQFTVPYLPVVLLFTLKLAGNSCLVPAANLTNLVISSKRFGLLTRSLTYSSGCSSQLPLRRSATNRKASSSICRILTSRCSSISVKRQKQGGDWSIADLCRKDKRLVAAFSAIYLTSVTSMPMRKRGSFPRLVQTNFANCRNGRSRQPTSTEFQEGSFTRSFKPNVDQHIVPLCDGDARALLAALKTFEVILRTHRDLVRNVERKIDELFYRVDGSGFAAG